MVGYKLFILQHGDAEPKEVIAERPLSAKGREDVGRLAGQLERASVRVGEIRQSGKLRALQTAQIMAKHLTPGKEPLLSPGLKPKDSPEEFAGGLEGLEEDLMIVSHLPFVERLASFLLTGSSEGVSIHFHPGSMVCLECREQGVWDLLWMVNPRHLPL